MKKVDGWRQPPWSNGSAAKIHLLWKEYFRDPLLWCNDPSVKRLFPVCRFAGCAPVVCLSVADANANANANADADADADAGTLQLILKLILGSPAPQNSIGFWPLIHGSLLCCPDWRFPPPPTPLLLGTDDMVEPNIEEGLDHLAQKRRSVYESKKESLRREIDQLRDFFSSMEKERELLECQVKATQALCCRKLVKAEKELQAAQAQLRDTQNEAASLLEGKHQEMERIQKERDECHARLGHLTGETDLFRGYIRYLEEKICSLVAKLHEYHCDLQKKTEEIIKTRQHAVGELEWVKQSMMKFEQNLLEFNGINQPQIDSTNTQLSSEKNQIGRDSNGIKQLESSKSSHVKSVERIADAAGNEVHNNNQRGLQEKLRRLEEELTCANQRAELANSKLSDSDVTIANLRAIVSSLQEEVRKLKEKNLEYVTEKIEAEAGEQLKEAAISVLRLRIYALEGDLQQERHIKGGISSLNSKTKTLTQLSPDINVEIKTRAGLVFKRDINTRSDISVGKLEGAKLEAAKYQLQEDAETINNLRKVNAALKTDLQKERARNTCNQKLSSDAWSIKKIKKLEQALVESHDRYMLLRREMNELRSKNMLDHTAETKWKGDGKTSEPHGADDDSDTSQLVDELLGDHNIPFDMQNWRRDGDPNHEQHELDQRIKVPTIF